MKQSSTVHRYGSLIHILNSVDGSKHICWNRHFVASILWLCYALLCLLCLSAHYKFTYDMIECLSVVSLTSLTSVDQSASSVAGRWFCLIASPISRCEAGMPILVGHRSVQWLLEKMITLKCCENLDRKGAIANIGVDGVVACPASIDCRIAIANRMWLRCITSDAAESRYRVWLPDEWTCLGHYSIVVHLCLAAALRLPNKNKIKVIKFWPYILYVLT